MDFLFSGNRLSCDCRLSWIQSLRNETKSEPLRSALDDVTCTLNAGNKVENAGENNQAYNDAKVSKTEQLFEIETNSEVLQQDANDEEIYEDTNQYKFEPTVQPVVINQVPVVSLPIEALPCPRELRYGEDSLMLSSKDESYWQSSTSTRYLSSLSLVIVLTLISVF